MKLIHLTEGGDWQDEELTPGQEAALRGFGLVDVRSGSGRCRVKAKGGNNGWAGAVRLGTGTDTVELRVKPKIPIARLLYLVGYTRTSIDDLRWRDDEIDVGEADELVPAVAHAFARAASRALRQGLLLGYREAEETSMVVRGGIRAGDQMRKHYSFPLPAEIRFDDYTADIPENQLLRAAAERLLTVPHVPPVTVIMLRRLVLRFTDVSRLSPGHPLPEWQKNRLNTRYHTALGLARLVLRGDSYELNEGDAIRADGLFLLMWKLFQDFVTTALMRELERHGGRCYDQDDRYWLDAGKLFFKLIPDLVYDRPGEDGQTAHFAVIDAKYKTSGRADRDDMYAMLAYCTAFGVRHGYLISPGGPADRRRHQITRSGITITEHAIDLDQPPAEVRRQVCDLACEILSRD